MKIVAALLFVAALTLFHVYGQNPSNGTVSREADRSRLEIVEELSESLANDLLELSVATRDQDLDVTSAYFPALIAGKNFPSNPLQAKTQVKWIELHGWEAPASDSVVVKTAGGPDDPGSGRVAAKAFLQSWTAFLDNF